MGYSPKGGKESDTSERLSNNSDGNIRWEVDSGSGGAWALRIALDS